MRATPKRVGLACLGLSGFLLAALWLSLALGTADVGPAQVWDWLRGELKDPMPVVVLSRLRLPRILLAACVGASLSLCGVAYQGVLRNPLAEPFILGISGGAAVGAIIGHTLGWYGLWPVAGLAFLGALSAILMVLAITRRRGRMDSATLVLTGVMLNAFFSAVIMFIIATTTDQKLHAIMYWLYGDLSGAELSQSWLLGPVVLIGGIVLFGYSRHLNLLSSGDQAAAAAGVDVNRVKLILFLLASFICGITVSLSGLIGFIGLMIPHLVRVTLGHDHRLLLPASGLLGAAFLVLADTGARTVISPSQLPVGVITAFFGAPFFMMLLARRGSRWW